MTPPFDPCPRLQIVEGLTAAGRRDPVGAGADAQRFTAVLREMDVRFAAVEKRFGDTRANFARMQRLIGIGFVAPGSLVSIFHCVG